MLYAVKTLLSALIIMIATELSKRSSSLAAFILALPIVSIIAICWIYYESEDTLKIADITYETFWYVLPTLPMFLLLSYLLRNGYNFYISLFACCVITAILFYFTQYLVSKFLII